MSSPGNEGCAQSLIRPPRCNLLATRLASASRQRSWRGCCCRGMEISMLGVLEHSVHLCSTEHKQQRFYQLEFYKSRRVITWQCLSFSSKNSFTYILLVICLHKRLSGCHLLTEWHFFPTCLVSVVFFSELVKILHNRLECTLVKVQDLSEIQFQTSSEVWLGNREVDERTLTNKEVFIR